MKIIDAYEIHHQICKCYEDYAKPEIPYFTDAIKLCKNDFRFKAKIDKIIKPVNDYIQSFKYALDVNGQYLDASITNLFIDTIYSSSTRTTYYDLFVTISNEYKHRKYSMSSILREIEDTREKRILKIIKKD